MPVFVTHADTAVGVALVEALTGDGADVRAFASGEGDVAAVRDAGAIVALGDHDDEGHLEAAMTHAHTVVVPHVGWLTSATQVSRDWPTIVRAAVQAEVSRIVVVSLVGAAPDATLPLLAALGAVETDLVAAAPQTLVVRTDGVVEDGHADVAAILSTVSDCDGAVMAPVERPDLVRGLVALDAARSGRSGGHALFTALGRPRPLGSGIDAGTGPRGAGWRRPRWRRPRWRRWSRWWRRCWWGCRREGIPGGPALDAARSSRWPGGGGVRSSDARRRRCRPVGAHDVTDVDHAAASIESSRRNQPLSTRALACFDLDGCLIDSSRAIPAGVNAGLGAVGLPSRSASALQWCIGPPLSESFTTLLAEHGVHDEDQIATAIKGYRAAYPAVSVELTTVVPGIDAVLAQLPQRRVIVTSKPADYARPLAVAMGLMVHFDDLFGPSTDLVVEPKTATLARALDSVGATAGTAVMIGDRRHDVDAGLAVGTATIGVTWGAGDRTELSAAGAHHVVDEPSQLRTLLG